MKLDLRMQQELQALDEKGNKRQLRTMLPDGVYLRMGESRYLNLSSNDYLGLSHSAYAHVDLCAYWGMSPEERFLHGNPSSRLMTGNSPEYEILEAELAALFPEKQALVLSSGYMANLGLISGLAQAGDLVLADKLVHASLIDGLRLSAADFKRFQHNDVAHLERLLQACGDASGQIWVVVESVYSMDGDFAPLRDIVALKQKYDFALIVDEAHSIGLYGEQGQGICAELGILSDVDALMMTFGKALAGAGSAILCSPLMREYLINKMRPLIFSTALPPVTLLWNAMVLRECRMASLHERVPERFPSMAALRAHLRKLQTTLGELLNREIPSSIVPVHAGANENALRMAATAQEAGYWVTAIRPPTVPENQARLRLSLHAGMTLEHIHHIAELCKKLG